MSFVSTGEMTRKAQREGYAVPAFNAENLEMAQAIIQAASRRAPRSSCRPLCRLRATGGWKRRSP